ncbi:transporter, CPA2 family [Filimonas lacunae]|uniref:Transporter, CPA2 family n=1 Tax=Filimonas lacunae TaxID=477680 RepID=A0A173MDX9_9BACT|nr:cation:proton antiporter [Filimonas lacunae]BAV05803.1 proton antiporter RosB [Filimonas lacunae]SIT28570.1 transporter, CPA2 family [Filimonas lacunae]
MTHLPKLIEDLALILMAGAVTTLLFRRLKQPLVLGYIIAGLLVGPHIAIVPTVIDTENINVLAEIGVIFLLFSLGLEFSFKKLVRVGGASSITAVVEVLGMLGIGYAAGRILGWSQMDSIFLGGILSISSTTIIIRAFEELGVKSQNFAGLVFGVLIVEDLVAILLLVLLSTMAVSRQFAGNEMLFSVLKLVFFLSLWFIAGIFLIPTFLKRARKLLSEETLLILSLGLCLGMVVLATKVGFSPALGAFVMGSILAETTKAEKITHLVKPVKDLFAAVFFVSVGILIDPKAIIQHGGPVILITLLTIFGKFFSSTVGAVLSGQPLKQSIQAGMSLAQIGEFSFIIATLGLTLKVTSDFLYPIAVAVSAITTFTTPYLIRASEPFYHFLDRKLPRKFIDALNKYSSGTQDIQAESDWKIVIRSYVGIILTNMVISVAIILLFSTFLTPWVREKFNYSLTADIIILLITFAASAPFTWAMMAKKPETMAYTNLWLDKKYNRGPLVIIEIIRNLLAVFMVGFLVDTIFSGIIAILVAIPVMIIVLYIFSKKMQLYYGRIEKRFLRNLNARESREIEEDNSRTSLSPWDAHLASFEISPYAGYVGVSLLNLAWRERFGVNLAYIERGGKMIYAPSRDEKLFPYDRIGVIGTDEQLIQLRPLLEDHANEITYAEGDNRENIVLQKLLVDEHTKLKGQSIRGSGIREKTNGLVVGIERNGKRLLNPTSDSVFEWDDVIWIVGDRRKIQKLYVKGGE